MPTIDVSAAALLADGRRLAVSGELQPALKLMREALELDNSLEPAIRPLRARLYLELADYPAGLTEAERALVLEPANSIAHYVKARCCYLLGRPLDGIASVRRVLEEEPDPAFHSKLIFLLNYDPASTPESLYEEAARWNAKYAAPLRPSAPKHLNEADPNRRLKIGYVSPDLYSHAVVKLLEPVLDHHDRSQFEVFLYSAAGSKHDHVTERLEKTNEHFVCLPEAAEDIARRIQEDQIDILVDVASHTSAQSSFLAFGFKPAPVQVSWMGYLGTTGMPVMDYFLGDAFMPCPGTEHLFTETVHRLERIPCSYRPPATVEIVRPPYFKNGYITFGCFNDHKKINSEVVKPWSAIMHLVPRSRLFLKYYDFDKPAINSRLLTWFEENGIEKERIQFEGAEGALLYLHAWNEVDIALDPFPYNGGTTTMDALWMGVPVVTLAGRLAVQRSGASILAALALPFAQTPEEYICTALFLAENIPSTPGIRHTVHNALAASPLMDDAGFTRSLEQAFRQMWHKWCQSEMSTERPPSTTN